MEEVKSDFEQIRVTTWNIEEFNYYSIYYPKSSMNRFIGSVEMLINPYAMNFTLLEYVIQKYFFETKINRQSL